MTEFETSIKRYFARQWTDILDETQGFAHPNKEESQSDAAFGPETPILVPYCAALPGRGEEKKEEEKLLELGRWHWIHAEWERSRLSMRKPKREGKIAKNLRSSSRKSQQRRKNGPMELEKLLHGISCYRRT